MLELKELGSGKVELTLTMPGCIPISCAGEGLTYTGRILAHTLADIVFSRIEAEVKLAGLYLREGFSARIFDEAGNVVEYKQGDEDALRSRLDNNSPPYEKLFFNIKNGNETVYFGSWKGKNENGHDVTFRTFWYDEYCANSHISAWGAQSLADFKSKLTSSVFECLLDRMWKEKEMKRYAWIKED